MKVRYYICAQCEKKTRIDLKECKHCGGKDLTITEWIEVGGKEISKRMEVSE